MTAYINVTCINSLGASDDFAGFLCKGLSL